MRDRRGFSMIEIAVAGSVLAVLMIVVMQLIGTTTAQRQATADRRMAAREAANLMERLFASSWEDLAAEKIPNVRLSDDLRRMLSESRLNIEIAERNDHANDDPHGKRILVEISWLHRPGQPRRSVRLVALRYHVAPQHETGTATERVENNGDNP